MTAPFTPESLTELLDGIDKRDRLVPSGTSVAMYATPDYLDEVASVNAPYEAYARVFAAAPDLARQLKAALGRITDLEGDLVELDDELSRSNEQCDCGAAS